MYFGKKVPNIEKTLPNQPDSYHWSTEAAHQEGGIPQLRSTFHTEEAKQTVYLFLTIVLQPMYLYSSLVFAYYDSLSGGKCLHFIDNKLLYI